MEAANITMSASATLHTKHAARIEVALDIADSFMNSAPFGVGHAEMTRLYISPIKSVWAHGGFSMRSHGDSLPRTAS